MRDFGASHEVQPLVFHALAAVASGAIAVRGTIEAPTLVGRPFVGPSLPRLAAHSKGSGAARANGCAARDAGWSTKPSQGGVV
jgi:hypothetical protein